MRDDERDDANSAPVPPYERHWRHPAEKAADERLAYQRLSTPPPLSRRASAYIGTLGALGAVAVLSVAVPKGISDYTSGQTDTSAPRATESSAVPVKGLVSNPMIIVAGSHGATSALPLGDGHFITSLEAVTSRGNVWITLSSGDDVEAQVVSADADSGIALIQSADPRAKGPFGNGLTLDTRTRSAHQLNDPTSLTRLRIVDGLGAQAASADDGVTTSEHAGKMVIHTPRAIDGMAVVASPAGDIVGVAVRRAQATWVFTIASLRGILTSVFGLTDPVG